MGLAEPICQRLAAMSLGALARMSLDETRTLFGFCQLTSHCDSQGLFCLRRDRLAAPIVGETHIEALFR